MIIDTIHTVIVPLCSNVIIVRMNQGVLNWRFSEYIGLCNQCSKMVGKVITCRKEQTKETHSQGKTLILSQKIANIRCD